MKKPKWNTEGELWVGDRFVVSNSSQGYHGIEKQWWEYYAKKDSHVLLISEDKKVADEFQSIYPKWKIGYTNLPFDLCKGKLVSAPYDLIICQATMEHLYDPFGAMRNMAEMLSQNGILVIHTHPVNFPKHDWPHDFFRFQDDWWSELPKHLPIELLEFYNWKDYHVFACYRRVK